MSSRTAVLVAAASTAALVLAGCGSNTADSGDSGKISVVASTNVWGSVAKAVGGDRVDVRSIIDSPKKDPHDYQSTAADTASIGKAALTVRNGGGYDEFFADAVRAAGGKHQSVDAFALSGKSGADVNEHVFYHFPTVKRVADAVAAKLGKIDPKGKQRYAANAKRFDGRIDGLQSRAEKIGKGKRLSALATESVAGYLLDTAGVRDSTPSGYAEAVEKDQDIPASAIAATNKLVTGHRVSMLVDNAQTETETAQQLRTNAERAAIPVVKVTETFPAGVRDYVRWMGGEIDGLERATR